jgi:hypothetical protein
MHNEQRKYKNQQLIKWALTVLHKRTPRITDQKHKMECETYWEANPKRAGM